MSELPPHEPDYGRTGNPALWCARCRIEAEAVHAEPGDPDDDRDPYEVLEKEMAIGKTHAEGLVRHLMRMGAGRGTLPVEIDGRKFLVCVEEPTAAGPHRVHQPSSN